MNRSVKDLQHLLMKLYYPRGVDRETAEGYLRCGLVCTPFGGNCGKKAGWAICVNGSPPKGTLIVSGEGPDEVPTFFLGATAKRMGEKQDTVIQAFYDEHLRDKPAAFVMKPKEVPLATLAP
jgi:hypothetical protein